jgi:hypothetical protein
MMYSRGAASEALLESWNVAILLSFQIIILIQYLQLVNFTVPLQSSDCDECLIPEKRLSLYCG